MGTQSKNTSARIPLLNIGHNNYLVAQCVEKVIPIRASQPLLTRRIRNEAKQQGLLINCSQGRAARSVIILNSGHIVLTSKESQTVKKALMDGHVDL